MKEIFNEVHKVTKEGKFLIVNSSPVIEPRKSRSHMSKRYPIPFDLNNILINDGWMFIDDTIWAKPEPSVKNRNGGFYRHRKPLAYKPNIITEYIMVYRKETEKLIDWNLRKYDKDIIDESKVSDGYESSNIWYISPTSSKKHTAIFPEELSDKVISYYSMIGDVVLDPFAGSGTVGVSANKLNRNFILCEKNEKYYNYMKTIIDAEFLN